MRYPNFNIEEYLRDEDIHYRVHSSDDHIEYAINCPKCVERGEKREDTKYRCWVNITKGQFWCYNCHWAGMLPRLIKALSRVDDLTSFKMLRGRALDSIDHMNLKLYEEPVNFSEDDEELSEIELPFGFEPIEGPHPYLEQRGIPWEVAADNDWGFCRVGYCKDRIIVPSFMNYSLVFWQARATWDLKDGEKKVLNPRGVSARHVLYNYDEAKDFKEIVIVEGFMDAVKVGPHAVATNGKKLHPQQVAWLQQTKAERVTLMWDKDAWEDARRRGERVTPSSVDQASSLLKIAFEVRAVKMPDERDPGDYSYRSEDLSQLISSARPM